MPMSTRDEICAYFAKLTYYAYLIKENYRNLKSEDKDNIFHSLM